MEGALVGDTVIWVFGALPGKENRKVLGGKYVKINIAEKRKGNYLHAHKGLIASVKHTMEG